MRCVAHTLQLAIEDALQQETLVGKLILSARNVVKTLRTPTFLYMLKKEKFKKPIIDCTTRWGSTFDMLSRLLQLKMFCREIDLRKFNNFKNVSDGEWDRVTNIIKVLEPCRKYTTKLQYLLLLAGVQINSRKGWFTLCSNCY